MLAVIQPQTAVHFQVDDPVSVSLSCRETEDPADVALH